MTETKRSQVRQGDVLVVPTTKLLEGDRQNRHMDHATLAHGEVTGHFHGIKSPSAAHFRPDDVPSGCFSLRVDCDSVVLEHTKGNAPAEHAPVTVSSGNHVSLVPHEYNELGESKRVVD